MAPGKKPKPLANGESMIVVKMLPLVNRKEALRTIEPTKSSINNRSFKKRVNPGSVEKWPCESSWERDVSFSRIRNRYIKDLSFDHPRCCTDLFNHMRDKKNSKKLKSYHLDKAIRPVVGHLRMEEYRFEYFGTENVDCVQVPECYIVEFDNDDSSGSDAESPQRNWSECSGCDTLGQGFKRLQKTPRDFREILQRPEPDPCDPIRGASKKFKISD